MTRNVSYTFAKPAIAASAHDLFATRIWQARLTPLAPRFAEWIAHVEAMRAASPTPAGRTNRHGWNSQVMAVLDEPMFADLRETITTQTADALRQMHGISIFQLVVTQSGFAGHKNHCGGRDIRQVDRIVACSAANIHGGITQR